MNTVDWLVLLGTMIGIAAYGTWRTRHTDNLNTYLKGNHNTGWLTIGISVMATQASTITYLSLPGQAYENGIAFIQNYFGLPLALILVAAVFLPIYRKLGVYTAYEYLGKRFDAKTRLLGAALFLLQRGIQTGITIYAPAIILCTVFGWRLDLTIIFTGLLAIIYTVTGGSAAVNLTQRWQMAVIFCGMLTAFIILLVKLPSDALPLAGAMGKLQAVDFDPDIKKRYTILSGVLGGFFLSLSYFGTDQSQVQRYIGGAGLREGRLGLMFNAVFKIPMQFLIVMLGAMLFVFYQFQPNTPVWFNQAEWQRRAAGVDGAVFRAIEVKHAALQADKQEKIRGWMAARERHDVAAEASAREEMVKAKLAVDEVRKEARHALDPKDKVKDSDYVFVTFVLSQLPHGLIGLLIAVMFASALSSKAGELNALGTTSTIDLWRHIRPLAAHDEARNVRNAKWFTAFWGFFAIGFALFVSFAESLIEALNIVASIFYPALLGVFIVAFFLKHVRGSAVFWAAVGAQILVVAIYWIDVYSAYSDRFAIGYLWLNPIGCVACVLFSLLLQAAIGSEPPPAPVERVGASA